MTALTLAPEPAAGPTLDDVRDALRLAGVLPEQVDRVVVVDGVESVVLVHCHGTPDVLGWWRGDRFTFWRGAA